MPFCAHRCDYCAFATWDDRPHLLPDYVNAVAGEVEAAVEAGLGAVTSVFFGGGTPSILDPDQLDRILGAFSLVPGAEVTVECNPESVDEAKLVGYAAAGVTRLSFGAQSFDPVVLEGLGRRHDPASVRTAVEAARAAGLEEFNLDLIYGGAGEDANSWRRTVEAALALDPPHISAYALTVEAGTPLASQTARHPDDDVQADRYVVADDLLTEAGLTWYEISNWARPGHECRHNQLYWTQGDYAGFGCAAHSHRHGRRYWNVRSVERYLDASASGRAVLAGEMVLGPQERILEKLQLALRTRAGVPAGAIEDLDLLVEAGLVDVAAGRAVLSQTGRLLANEVAVRLRVTDDHLPI